MQPYMERAASVACESQIAVQVLLSSENDVELVPLKPQQRTYISPDEFTARKLRPIGVAGLRGFTPAYVFREPLEPCVTDAIAAAFLVHAQMQLGESFAQSAAASEVAELERMYLRPDTRY